MLPHALLNYVFVGSVKTYHSKFLHKQFLFLYTYIKKLIMIQTLTGESNTTWELTHHIKFVV